MMYGAGWNVFLFICLIWIVVGVLILQNFLIIRKYLIDTLLLPGILLALPAVVPLPAPASAFCLRVLLDIRWNESAMLLLQRPLASDFLKRIFRVVLKRVLAPGSGALEVALIQYAETA